MDNNRAEDEIERAELGRKTEGIGNRTRTETEEALGGVWRRMEVRRGKRGREGAKAENGLRGAL